MNGTSEQNRAQGREISGTPENGAARELAAKAMRALLYEVAVTPKPGLVDRADSGAHRDMDFFTFLDSAAALLPYFEICAAAGLKAREEDAARSADDRERVAESVDGPKRSALDELLAQLREPGREAEAAMRRATGGANTHKGAIFVLGILTAAAGYCLATTVSPAPEQAAEKNGSDRLFEEELLSAAERIAGPVLKDFECQAGDSQDSFGLRQYALSGCTGVRGEAAAGFPAVRNIALPIFQGALGKGRSLNDAGVEALLHLILNVEDTTLLKRCGSREAVEAERTVLRTLLAGGSPVEAARQLNARWIERNISAGGCADLLGAAFFVWFLGKP